jgi:FADH2 O2-dependent halogenase
MQRDELMEQIQCAIEPFDLAGLCDRSRRNWYPVNAEDLLGATGKLGASRAEIEKLLSRSGFYVQ